MFASSLTFSPNKPALNFHKFIALYAGGEDSTNTRSRRQALTHIHTFIYGVSLLFQKVDRSIQLYLLVLSFFFVCRNVKRRKKEELYDLVTFFCYNRTSRLYAN